MHKATVIKVDGTEYQLDHRPTLKESQEIVGGYIEFAHPDNKGKKTQERLTLVVDEDGLVKGKPLNLKATNIYQRSPIVGDVILLEGWQTVG